MTWFKVDDGFWRHHKVRKLGRDKLAAVGIWTLSGNWAADNLETNIGDGFVPWEVIEGWDPKRRYAKRLIEVGLWRPVEIGGEEGIVFHDWADRNPTREEREEERRSWRQKKAAQRSGRRAAVPQVSPGDTRGTPPGTPPESPPGSLPKSPQENPSGVHRGVPEMSGIPSRPVPSRSGSLGGERSGNVAPRVDQRPPEKCPRHANHPDPPACGACADARRAAETWDRDTHTATRMAIRDCPRCDGDGWRLEPGRRIPITPYVKCDHQPQPATATPGTPA